MCWSSSPPDSKSPHRRILRLKRQRVSGSIWGMTPKQSIQFECDRRSPKDVVRDCVALLNNQAIDDHFLRVIGGPSAESVLEGRDGGLDGYWPDRNSALDSDSV